MTARRGVSSAGTSPRLQVAHTAHLEREALTAARALLDEVFGADMNDHDWDHALGGMHALIWEERALIGHASVVQRRLIHAGRALRTGYVEAVAVRADRRRRGHAATMMRAIERIVRRGYDLGALGASAGAVPFYEARRWRRWEGPTSVLTPQGVRRTPEEDGAIYVLPVEAALDFSGELVCDWRDGDVW